jgi:hypothetical protein
MDLGREFSGDGLAAIFACRGHARGHPASAEITVIFRAIDARDEPRHPTSGTRKFREKSARISVTPV